MLQSRSQGNRRATVHRDSIWHTSSRGYNNWHRVVHGVTDHEYIINRRYECLTCRYHWNTCDTTT